MSAATSRYEVPPVPAAAIPSARLERGDGAAEIGLVRRGAVTALRHLFQHAPYRVLFPRAAPGDLPVAALLTTSGGLAGGDRLRLQVSIGAGAGATLTTAAAEKVYRSLGPDVASAVTIEIGEGGWLEYLPQETILFDGARLVRRLEARLTPSARLLAAEMLVFGRAAHGERFTRGLLHEAWRLGIGDRLVWADALRLEGDVAARLDAPFGLAGARALATVLYAGADAAAHLPLARDLAEGADCRGAATLVNGVLLARFFGPDAADVRRGVIRYVCALRREAAGLPAAMPRLWSS
jgi:urease accessory protein